MGTEAERRSAFIARSPNLPYGKTMSPADLDRLSLLHDAASPGPWYVRNMDDDLCCCATAVATKPNVSDDNDDLTDSTVHGVVAATYLQHRDYLLPADGRSFQNAEPIAALGTALPELLRLARPGAAAEQDLATSPSA